MKATNATQLSGSRMEKVPNVGRKKKLKHTTPSKEANTACREPQAVATKRIISRNTNAAVAGLMRAPRNFSASVASPMPVTAAAKPNQLLLESLGNARRMALSVGDG